MYFKRDISPYTSNWQIGTVTLLVPETFTNLYETACWYQEVRCDIQTVPLMSNGKHVAFRFDGLITASYFPSGFGGYYRYTEYQKKKDEAEIGKPSSYVISTDIWGLKHYLEHSTKYKIQLNEGLAVVDQIVWNYEKTALVKPGPYLSKWEGPLPV